MHGETMKDKCTVCYAGSSAMKRKKKTQYRRGGSLLQSWYDSTSVTWQRLHVGGSTSSEDLRVNSVAVNNLDKRRTVCTYLMTIPDRNSTQRPGHLHSLLLLHLTIPTVVWRSCREFGFKFSSLKNTWVTDRVYGKFTLLLYTVSQRAKTLKYTKII
jgi:hypothetical protein